MFPWYLASLSRQIPQTARNSIINGHFILLRYFEQPQSRDKPITRMSSDGGAACSFRHALLSSSEIVTHRSNFSKIFLSFGYVYSTQHVLPSVLCFSKNNRVKSCSPASASSLASSNSGNVFLIGEVPERIFRRNSSTFVKNRTISQFWKNREAATDSKVMRHSRTRGCEWLGRGIG